jgi:hypothetical protein
MHRDGCETRIDKVLDAVAHSDSDTLSILETDLFLSEEDMVGSEYGTMRNSFEKLLLSGKSIGILGIAAPFYGMVYDIPGPVKVESLRTAHHGRSTIPSGRTISYLHHGERPFFLIIMGDDEQILQFRSKIESQVLAGLPADAYHFVLFTLHPARSASTTLPKLLDTRNHPIPAYRTLPASPSDVPVVRLTTADPPILRQQADRVREAPDATLPLADFKISRQTVWAYRDDILRCQSTRWLPYQQPGLISADSGDTDLVLRLDKSGLRTMPNFTFLVHATVEATAVKNFPELTRWLYDWSFNARPEDVATVLRSKPKLFPVLNLEQLGTALQGIIASDFKPVIIADYLFAFQKAN